MKTKLLSLFILAYAQAFPQTPAPLCKAADRALMFQPRHGGFFEIGYYSTQVKSIGTNDFDISDSKIYGLKALDSSSKESRYRVPLSSLPQSVFLQGFSLATRWNYSKYVQGTLSIKAAFGKHGISTCQFATSVSPILVTYKRVRLLSEFAIGASSTSFDIYNMQPLQGYHPYFRGEDGFDVKPGDKLTITTSDKFFQAGITFQVALTRHTMFFANISKSFHISSGKMTVYSSTSGDDHKLKSGEEPIETANELKSEVSNPNPNYIRTYPVINIGFGFNIFDENPPVSKPVKRCSCCGQVIPD